MIDWLVKFFQNFSGYGLGWHHQRYAEVFNGSDGWNGVAICFIVICGIFLISNAIYFLVKGDKVLWKVYIPLALLYMASNIVFNAIICCLFLSLGPVWWIVLGIIYIIAAALINIMGVEEYDPWPGYFGFMGFVIQYSENCKKYVKHKRDTKQDYERFLAIKYE